MTIGEFPVENTDASISERLCGVGRLAYPDHGDGPMTLDLLQVILEGS